MSTAGDTADLEWGAPPTRTKGPGARARFAEGVLERLKAEPGEWARIKRYASKTGAWTSRKVFVDQNLLPGCELNARILPPGQTDFGNFKSGLWARYVEGLDLPPNEGPGLNQDQLRARAASALYVDRENRS